MYKIVSNQKKKKSLLILIEIYFSFWNDLYFHFVTICLCITWISVLYHLFARNCFQFFFLNFKLSFFFNLDKIDFSFCNDLYFHGIWQYVHASLAYKFYIILFIYLCVSSVIFRDYVSVRLEQTKNFSFFESWFLFSTIHGSCYTFCYYSWVPLYYSTNFYYSCAPFTIFSVKTFQF